MPDDQGGGQKEGNVIHVSFEKNRISRDLAELIAYGKANPIEPALDLRAIQKIHFSPTVMSWSDPESTHLHLIVHDVSDGIVHTVGVLRFTIEQWGQMKLEADRILTAHLDMCKKHKV